MRSSNPNLTSSFIVDDDSQQTDTSPSSMLTFHQALSLARIIRNELRPHKKDRKWGFKTYSDCFKATHAVSWGLKNIDSDEYVVVFKLNQLVDYGLLFHVVDPSKKFRVGDTRTLYFRMVCDKILDRNMSQDMEFSTYPGKGSPILSGEFGKSSVKAVQCNDLDAIQQQLENVAHILNHTVKELNGTRGKLEIVHQEALGLISQQISTYVMIFLIYAHNITFMSPWARMGWFGALGLALTMIISTRHGWQCISLWSDIDSRTGPMETIVIDDQSNQSSLGEGSIVRNAKSFGPKPLSTAIVSAVSKSFQSARKSVPISRENSAACMREAYSLPDVDVWKHRPLLICANTPVCPNLVPECGDGPIPLGVPFKFTSDLFEGTCLIRLKGSNSDNPQGDGEYFSGRNRIFQSVVQGRFKEEVPVSDVMTGHEFTRPFKNLPHPFILKTATSFIGKVAPGANISVHTDHPFVEAPLGGSSQVVRGDEPGNEPDITCHNIEEDCSVLGGAFSKGNMSISRRKRLFSNPGKCRDYTFDTKTVYTFEFYQNLFDAQSYSLDLGFAKIGCSNVLNGQPIQWLGKLRDGRYLWSFQIWHEKLLANDNGKKILLED